MSVDIVNQLFPNGVTVIVQLLSTFVLFVLMRKFLWRSVQRYLAKRSDKLQADLLDGEKAKLLALKDRDLAKDHLDKAISQSQEIVDKAVTQAKQESQLILQQAEKEAKLREERASEQIKQERLNLERSIKEEIVKVALTATAKVVSEKHVNEVDKQAINEFIEGKDHEK